MSNLATTYVREGKYAQAEALFTQTFEIQKRVLGPENPLTAVTVYNLGGVAARQGDKDKAIALLSQSVDHGLLPWVDLEIEKDPISSHSMTTRASLPSSFTPNKSLRTSKGPPPHRGPKESDSEPRALTFSPPSPAAGSVAPYEQRRAAAQ